MNFRNILIVVLALVVAAIIFYSFQGKDSGKEYEAEIKKEREAKDDYMRSSDESPFGDEKKNFVMAVVIPLSLFVWFIIAFLADGNFWLRMNNTQAHTKTEQPKKW